MTQPERWAQKAGDYPEARSRKGCVRPVVYPGNFKWRNTTTGPSHVGTARTALVQATGLRSYTPLTQLVHIPPPRTAANAISSGNGYIFRVFADGEREREREEPVRRVQTRGDAYVRGRERSHVYLHGRR